MKTIRYLSFIVILILLFGCGKYDQPGDRVVSGKLISNTSCKSFVKSSGPINFTPDTISLIEYIYDRENNKLILKHINAGFNCCPDSLFSTVELQDNTIRIEEFEKKALCHCLCLYDLLFEVKGIDRQQYRIRFVEPYAYGLNELIFDIDLTKETTGAFSVIRKHYPWGI
ncbi:MAG: hypothetical protein PHP30_09850 [Bacteroidales bacterium]|nr:hypothetical protein [Bacteroidales bacterium]MDD2426297.1 hypothetical protein [Bacteroidales bacterium]MDD3990379.1 hypothetical protein [Bacteroidales bacterium]